MGEVIWGVDFVGHNLSRRHGEAVEPVVLPVVRIEQFLDPNDAFLFAPLNDRRSKEPA